MHTERGEIVDAIQTGAEQEEGENMAKRESEREGNEQLEGDGN
jgi:hypothetical protein